MEHLDRDTLALLALGELPESQCDGHLGRCPTCAVELVALRDVAALARAADPADLELPAPPERVWKRIQAAVAAAGAPAGPAGAGAAGQAGADAAGQAGADAAGQAGAAADSEERDRSEVTALDSVRDRPEFGRSVRTAWLAAAAALALVVVVAAAIVTASQPSGMIVAELELEPLDDRAEAADARLVEDDGRLLLEVDGHALPDADGYYAVWLIDEAVEGMVSLGPLRAGEQHAVPEGLDPNGFPIVDVSLEPFDGDPTHSGDSLLRGQLGL